MKETPPDSAGDDQGVKARKKRPLLIGATLLVLLALLVWFFLPRELDSDPEASSSSPDPVAQDSEPPSQMELLHGEALPNFFAAFIQSHNPGEDPRVDDALQKAQRLTDDEELRQILANFHRALTSEEEEAAEHRIELIETERAYNARLLELGHPFAIVGGFVEQHHDLLYMPEIHRILLHVEVGVDEERYQVDVRERLDGFRRADQAIFYNADLERSWVRSDRALATISKKLVSALLSDQEVAGIEEEFSFGWRSELREEVRHLLGEEQFDDLLRSARQAREEQRELSEIAGPDTLSALRNAFLREKIFMAAAFEHRATRADYEPPCPGCTEEMSHFEASEVGGYVSGLTRGPHPLLGLFKLCFDHRYGARASYRGFLLMLREEEFRCRQTLPADFIARLQRVEEERFSPISQITIEAGNQ